MPVLTPNHCSTICDRMFRGFRKCITNGVETLESNLEYNLDKSEFVLNVSKNEQTIGFINESLMISNAGGY